MDRLLWKAGMIAAGVVLLTLGAGVAYRLFATRFAGGRP
jgi:hypothetical protein